MRTCAWHRISAGDDARATRARAAVRDDELHAFVGDARARAEADERRRRRWLVRQLDEDRAFDDVCARASRDGGAVDVHVRGGRIHRGRLLRAGPLLTVDAGTGVTAYITRSAVTGLRVRDGAAAGGGAPRRRSGDDEAWASLGDVLRDLAERRAAVTVGTLDGAVHRGRIDGVGRDVLWLADGMYLPLDAVTEVVTVP